MRVLITGSDGSLGDQLLNVFGSVACGISNKEMKKGKEAIEDKIDSYLEWINITHVVNNYGINHLSWIGETEKEDQNILIQNVMSAYWVVNHLVSRRQTCRVVNVASATYRVPQRCTSLYCASKAAMVQMTKVMARELAPKGWIVNAIAPGLMTDTNMAVLVGEQVKELRGWTEQQSAQYAMNLIPAGRFTNTSEIALTIKKILELPDYVNGTVIDAMGGV